MLILLMVILIIASIIVLLVKRNRESFYFFGMCVSLAIMLTGILMYISKKGGISKELQEFLFLSVGIKSKLQYFVITLDNLGFMIAIGRYSFPLFLLLVALHYSMIPWIRRSPWLIKIAFIMPILSLIVYYPTIFRVITKNNPELQQLIINCSMAWIILYVILSLFLLLYEAYSINMKFFRRQFYLIVTFLISLCLLYLLYFGQDPAQVYQFYTAEFVWKQGIYYMNFILSKFTYSTIVIFSLICAVVGFTSLLKYTKEIFEASSEEIITQRKFENISFGTSVFVHSIKNQLLANRVIHKRLVKLYEEDSVDYDKVKEYIERLSSQNEGILARMDELYQSVKTNAVHLTPIFLSEVIESSIERFEKKYPNYIINISINKNPTVLADLTNLGEAIYNLLTNAQEAINQAGLGETDKVSLICYTNRLYTVIEVRDNGIGISKGEMKKIFEPFYTSKNTNYNWGMGLHYVRVIAQEHFGNLRFESKIGEGSVFYLLLPKFKG